MSLTARIAIRVQSQGLDLSAEFERSAEMGIEPGSVALPAGKLSTDWAKTDANTGMATLAGGHGLQSLDMVDVFWAGGCRYGMTATVATNEVTVDGGAGDNLPDTDTAVIVTKQVSIPLSFDGDDLQVIAGLCDQRCHLDFQDSGNATLEAIDLTAGEPYFWAAGMGLANRLTGNAVAALKASNGTTTAATLQLTGLQDAVA